MLIYDSSLANGVFHDIWKLARVTPIHKSGLKTAVNNYRPISVTHDQLFEFLKINKSITCNQAAFRKLYPTITLLINRMGFWHENIDRNNVNLTIILDLKKAFDTVHRDTFY